MMWLKSHPVITSTFTGHLTFYHTMEHLKDFASEFSKPFAICFDLLAKSNISIYNESKIRGKLRILALVVFYVTFYSSLVVSFKKVFTGELGFYELANLLPIFIVATQGAMKGIVIVSNLSKAKTVIDELGSMWRTTGLTKTQLMKKGVMLKRLNLCNAVFYWMNITGTWQYILVPLFETLFRNFVLGQDQLLFPFLCSLPYDAKRNWMVYLGTYFWESYSMLHLIYMYLGVEFLMITLCSHLATEFELLREEMLHAKPILEHSENTSYKDHIGRTLSYSNNEDDDAIDYFEEDSNENEVRADEDGPNIQEVIRRHQTLIKLSELLDDIFNRMIFFNLLFATITICFFGFVAKSAGVADSAYHNLWYEGDTRYQKIIIFIIVRSQQPCCLTSMRYAQVTLNTFTTVLSTTWSYFSLAISVYET
ncbi:putative odorant receptor 92a isoform X2 [Cydia pomonella]|uniref:putative odorant receptor 92a isoform X2 n=1 Tax=Cydia pomonella TaxID=82600 RepID=UPI002ADE1908|nr:putative odorant receptor 92a isoform X2 [Cydia pomonella]